MLAFTHAVPPELASCELTFLERSPIDTDLATRQHADYCSLLARCGLEVRTLAVSPGFPDAVFLEDTALVLDEVAVACSMGVPSRRQEVDNLRPLLAEHRRVVDVRPPATLEGGDVLRVGRTLYAGLSARTNRQGVESLSRIAAPLGYRVVPVPVRNCLHLKTACTALDERTLLANPAWVDLEPFAGMTVVPVPPAEPFGANTLRIGDRLCLPASKPATAARLRDQGYRVETVDVSELEKAEAGVTCLSILL